jgi:hypothetical protein
MNHSVTLDLPFSMIQSLRLAHAVMETNYEVCLSPEAGEKFLPLQQKFGAQYRITSERPNKLSGVRISHQEPKVYIGSIERSLVFPHSIFAYSRRLWAKDRTIRFSFAGLLTKSRVDFFQKIVERNGFYAMYRFKILMRLSSWAKLNAKFWRRLGLQKSPEANKFTCSGILFWSSERGRTFPVKAWDDEYFRLLATSEFVLCPSGDYIWTYRFFEAAMCGAIPIIETYCPAYDGFRFRTTDEPMSTLQWSQEDAEYNYELCRSRLTVPIDVLQQEIESLLQKC